MTRVVVDGVKYIPKPEYDEDTAMLRKRIAVLSAVLDDAGIDVTISESGVLWSRRQYAQVQIGDSRVGNVLAEADETAQIP